MKQGRTSEGMRFQHIHYEGGTGRRSKEVETYNFHKAAAVLAEYGFDCIRLADDWRAADFLAHHRGTGETLRVQLKTCLVIDRKYEEDKDLYMCFPLDGTGNWYLIRHTRLMEIVGEYSPKWLCSRKWKENGSYWHYTAKDVRGALKEYAYQATYGSLGFRECTQRDRAAQRMAATGKIC